MLNTHSYAEKGNKIKRGAVCMVSIWLIKTNENVCYISKNDEKLFNKTNEEVTIRFGGWEHKAIIKTNVMLPNNTIAMPKHWFQDYDMPTELPYEIVVKEQTILIGPVIAFVLRSKLSNISLKTLEFSKKRLEGYANINGLIYICAGDSINVDTRSVEGYYFNPHAKDKNERWKHGVFPLPGAVFKRRSIPRLVQSKLQKIIGRTIFNSNYFNKWDLYDCVSGYEVKKYFPSTERFTDINILKEMLNKFPVVYLKPRLSYKGKGIYMVRKKDRRILFTSRDQEEFEFENMTSAEAFIEQFVSKKNYLVQKGIEVPYQQHADFRLFLQKNHKKEWVCQGIVGRFAKKNSIITNTTYLDHFMQGREALQEIFALSNIEAEKLKSEMIQAAIDTCKVMDRELGHYGDVAIDMIVDKNKQAWILEANHFFYGYKGHLSVESKEANDRVRQTPFEYAKTLCGF
jgi:hypothetical protein